MYIRVCLLIILGIKCYVLYTYTYIYIYIRIYLKLLVAQLANKSDTLILLSILPVYDAGTV